VRVLLVDGYAVNHPDSAVVQTAIETLEANDHVVDHAALHREGFQPFMTGDERAAYHEASPLLTEETRAGAASLKASQGLLFCYPTTTFTVPAIVKGWLDRVLVPGVAFVFDEERRIHPGMTNIRRLGLVTTTSHSAAATKQSRDGGRRTILRTVRISANRFCRRTFVSVPSGSDNYSEVRRRLARW